MIVVDTGVLFGAVDRDDPYQADCAAVLEAGDVERIDLTDGDWDRVAELIEDYADLGLGTVDASVVAIAERLGLTTIATLNKRDFRVVRPSHVDAFELVP